MTQTTSHNEEDVQVGELSDSEFRDAVQLLADRLGFKFTRLITPDYSIVWMKEHGT